LFRESRPGDTKIFRVTHKSHGGPVFGFSLPVEAAITRGMKTQGYISMSRRAPREAVPGPCVGVRVIIMTVADNGGCP
jgi:hypothetical protein